MADDEATFEQRITRRLRAGAMEQAARDHEGDPVADDLFGADHIYRRVAATADEEFQRTPRMLFFSGIAAGVSIGSTFLARMGLGAQLSAPGEMPGDLLYPIGFILVVLGRYQLFTENTLTPVTLVMARIASLRTLGRLWGIVLVGNLFGAALIAALLSVDGALTPEMLAVGEKVAAHALEQDGQTLFVRGVLAGGLVASMVWLVHAVTDGTARLLIVYAIMIMIPVNDLFHCITGFCEVLFGVIHDLAPLPDAFGFLFAVAAGNIVGGVLFVAAINYGQTRERRFPDRDCNVLELSWREFFLGQSVGREAGDAIAPELDRTRAGAGG